MIGRMPAALRRLVKARRAVDAVAIEQRERRIAELRRAIDERFGQRRALQKAERRGGVELDVRHDERSTIQMRFTSRRPTAVEPGTGMSFRRRYTVSCARWWTMWFRQKLRTQV